MKAAFAVLLLAIGGGALWADDGTSTVLAGGSSSRDGSYQVPRIVYVGDPATLVVPIDVGELKTVAAAIGVPAKSMPGKAILVAGGLTPRQDVAIRAVELAIRRNAAESAEIRIVFTAFAPGRLDLPTVAVGGLRLEGLHIDIASVLTGNDRNPAPAAGVRMAPGTLPLLYGLACLLGVGIGGGFAAATRGRIWMRRWSERRRRRRSFRSLGKLLDELRAGGDAVDGGVFMDRLTAELRAFLTILTGVDCRPLTPPEFPEAFRSAPIPDGSAVFLQNFFSRSDAVRFGRQLPVEGELTVHLEKIAELLTAFNRGQAEGVR